MTMRKTTLISFLSLALALTFTNSAGAQWALPPNVYNLIGDLDAAILNLTNWLLGLVAMAAVVAMVWGGINYIGASGDTQKADLSKRIIYYSFLGIFVAGIAYAIVRAITLTILR